MTIKQNIKGVKSGGKITQGADGEVNSVEQNIENSQAEGDVTQQKNNNFLNVGKMRASGIFAVIVLGILVSVYIYYGN